MKKIRRIIAAILSYSLLFSACAAADSGDAISAPQGTETLEEDTQAGEMETVANHDEDNAPESASTEQEQSAGADTEATEEKQVPDFYGLNDPSLLQYVEDSVFADLESNFESDDYIVDDIQAIYISQDYLDELAYNAKPNIYFGYTLEDIERQYDGVKFIFTLGDDGSTLVRTFEGYDDTFDQVVQNVAIGGGVILVCVTVSVITGGLGAPAVSLVFAAAADTGAKFALSSGVISAATTAAITGYQTKDLETTMKAALLRGSESFKWGAITGSIMGGVSEAITIKNPAPTSETSNVVPRNETANPAQTGEADQYLVGAKGEAIPTPRQAELLALQEYPGTEQLTYLAGEKVPWGTPGGTRPDIVRVVGDHIEAIEVKNYDLANNSGELYRELARQISDRVTNLPPGSTQRIVLNVQGRAYTQEFVSTIVETIQTKLFDIYPNIPVDIMGSML